MSGPDVNTPTDGVDTLGPLTGYRTAVAAPRARAAARELAAMGADAVAFPVADGSTAGGPAAPDPRAATRAGDFHLVVVGSRAGLELLQPPGTLGAGGGGRPAEVLSRAALTVALDEEAGRGLRSAGLAVLRVPDGLATRELSRLVAQRVDQDVTRRIATDVGPFQVRGSGFVHADAFRPLPPAQATLLRVLASHPGRVFGRPELLRRVPGIDSERALEMCVCRLRAALPAPLVGTVVRRGYRLVA